MIEMPDFDNMSPKQIREWGNDLVRAANENGDIRATSSPKIRCSILNYKGQIEEHYEQQNKDFAERIEWSEEHDG